MKGMILHCGAQEVNRDDVISCETPDNTKTWYPIPHGSLLTQAERFVREAGLQIVSESHGLTANQNRYFGMLEVRSDFERDDYSLIVGMRNSHDKRFPAGLVLGASVFVCDNLSFSGEVNLSRKHTRFINRDLPGVLAKAVGRLGTMRRAQDHRIAAYKNAELTDAQVHDLVIRAMDKRVIPPTKLPYVVREWREPRHEEFRPRTGWSLFNAFTEILKGSNITELPGRTQKLHGILDAQFSVAG